MVSAKRHRILKRMDIRNNVKQLRYRIPAIDENLAILIYIAFVFDLEPQFLGGTLKKQNWLIECAP